jgi:cell wall-associated NlpC family hydrolase
VASNRLKRTMRGALAATAIVAVIGATPSVADPAPSTTPATPTTPTMPTGSPLQVYQQLSQQAETLDQQLLNAQDQQKAAQTTLNNANADLAKAQQAVQAAENTEAGLRGQVDQLTDAQYEGARFGQLSALLTGNSAKDYLDKASLLEDMAEDSSTTLSGMQAATDAATAAQQRAAKDQQTAQDATSRANDLVNQIQAAKSALQPLIQQAQQAELAVNPALLKNHVDPSQFIVPGGAAGTAIRAAEGFIGVPYHYGGTTPSGFDCSGLMQYVWREAGVDLPRTAAEQQQVGTMVSGESNLEPGDLVFFGSPAYHVGMYLGNGYMIDAPRTGEDVQIQPIFSGFSYGRRIS